jgi:hypothetical protein
MSAELNDELRLASDDAFYIEAVAAGFAHRDDLYGKHHHDRLLRIAEKLKTPRRPPASSERVADLLDEMRAFINLLKGAALLGKDVFTDERCRHIFEECVRLNGLYLGLAAPARGDVLASDQIKEPASASLKESDHG